MTTMSNIAEWENYHLDNKSTRTGHKIAFVTPDMDYDVTGFTTKNLRTHLIDHPRDEGLKQREQLWNFQQKYRGAANNKLRQVVSKDIESARGEVTDNEINMVAEGSSPPSISHRDGTGDLASRFRKRLQQKHVRLARIRPRDFPTTTDNSERPDKPREVLGIQRMYSSDLCVKSSIYSQIRNSDSDDKKQTVASDDRIVEALQARGPLEKLPDVHIPMPMKPVLPQSIKFFKTLNSYNKRVLDTPTPRRFFPIQRSLTNMSDLDSSRRKLLIVSRRDQIKNRVINLDYLETLNDDDEEDNRLFNRGISDEDSDADCEDNCEDEAMRESFSREVTCHDLPQYEDTTQHDNIEATGEVNTNNNVAGVSEECDSGTSKAQHYLTSEKSLLNEAKRETRRSVKQIRVKNSSRSTIESKSTDRNETSWTNYEQSGVTHKSKKVRGKKKSKARSTKDTECVENSDSSSEEGLDIPDDRYGPTTHSIDRKLAIRKPWEWRPSPYRWIDRAYVRESDKPYIERVINRGEIIDEFNYDSFARTRPLKLQAYPEGAGYKDKSGKMR